MLYNVAIVGATGSVGLNLIKILEERKFPLKNLFLFASPSSVGKDINFKGEKIKILSLDQFQLNILDFAFFAVEDVISKELAPKFVNAGVIVIDKSAFFRMKENVNLIIPEVNGFLLEKNFQEFNSSLKEGKKKGFIIASPNCCVIPLAIIFKIIDDLFGIKRLVISTYQSVSGAGNLGIKALELQTKSYLENDSFIKDDIFPQKIAFNIFPQIGDFCENGDTTEELKLKNELKKILNKQLNISVSCVRVPVFVGHSMSVNVECENPLDLLKLENIMNMHKIISCLKNNVYATPYDVVGDDRIFVSRLRKDDSFINSLNMWICSDNLRKGAALNVIHITENILKILK